MPVPMPGGQASHLYSGTAVEVEVDRDAMGTDETGAYAPGLPAVATVSDYANWTVYGVIATEDDQGWARLLALTITPMADPDGAGPGPFLHQRDRRSETWLARITIECVRRAAVIPDTTDDDELLRYVASIARKCARESENAADMLTSALGVSPRTVTRLRNRAVAAGYLDAHEGGRPRKTTTPKESA